MADEFSSASKWSGRSPERLRPDNNRTVYNNLAAQQQNGHPRNPSPQRGNVRNAVPGSPPRRRPSRHGQRGVRQLSNILSNSVNVSDLENDSTNCNISSQDVQESEIINSDRARSGGSCQVRMRQRRRQNHSNSMTNRGALPDALSSNPLENVSLLTGLSRSQTRGLRPVGHRLPRGSSNLSESIDECVAHNLYDPLVMPSPLARERLASPILTGQGTQYNPFLLSPDSDTDTDIFSPSLGGAAHALSDEEMARQLQQEEWEVASVHVNEPPMRYHHHHNNHHPLSRLIHRGGGHGPSQRAARHLVPFGLEGIQNLPFVQQELAPFVFELFHSYGVPDFDIQSRLNPDQADDYESLLALGEQVGDVNRGIAQTDINKLPTSKHRSITDRDGAAASTYLSAPPQCNICLMDYENGDKKRNLPCQHDFHKDCVDQWLRTNGTCPVCRSDVKAKFK